MPARPPQQPLFPLRTVAILALAGLIGLGVGYLTALTTGLASSVLAGASAAAAAVLGLHHTVGE